MKQFWKRLCALLLTVVFVLGMVPAQASASVEEHNHDHAHEEHIVVNSYDCAHDWYTEVTEPTCDEDGYTYYECYECGEWYEDDFVDALGHDYGITGHEPAGCEDEGYTWYECTRCGDYYEENFEDPLGHDYVEFHHEDPTCEDPGYTWFSCSRCGDEYETEDGEPLGHDLDEYGICTRCGDDSGHVCVYEEVEHGDATCTDYSWTYYECPICGDGYDVYGDTYADCVYESWVENATCEQGGYTYWSCVNCGDWYVTDETESLGHDYYAEYHEDATCEYWGYTHYVCNNCGNWYDEEDEEPAEHNWVLIETRDYPLEGYSCRVYECSECWEAYEERDYIYGSDNIYIVLTWGPTPRDLDSHLTLTTDASSGEVCYYNMTVFGENGNLLADLDTDDTTGYGPEQVTIYAPVAGGTYRYYVHDYTNRNDEGSDEMASSGATVQVYRGTTLLQTYTVPSHIRGNIWEVFSFDAESEEFEVLEHAYTTTHTDATCDEWGYTEYYCANCGDQYYENDEEPLGHDYVLEETANPTEHEWGYERYSCSRCGDELEEPIPPTGEEHYYVFSYHEPGTCQERGYDVYECVDCGDWYEVLNEGYGDHDWWCYHGTDATCTEDGYANYYCNWCDEEKVETTPALGHAYGRISRIGATCLNDGIDVYECSRCGDYYSIVTGEQMEHSYEESFRQEPTCCRGGFVVYTCTICGGSYVESMEAEPEAHNYELMFSRPATCSEWGEDGYECTECGAVTATHYEPTGEHEFVLACDTPATCAESGRRAYQCVNCGEWTEEYFEPTGEHDYVLTHEQEATCNNYGLKEHTCTVCRGIISEATEKIDHNYYVFSRWEPYGDEDGWVTYRCSMCGESYTETLPATGEKIVDEEGHFFDLDSCYLPTCEDWGNENYKCRLCDEWRTVYLEPTGEHNYTNHWYNLPTCDQWGSEIHNCENCMNDEVIYEGYEPLEEHQYYLSWIAAPTCSSWGYEEYQCRLCGETYRVYEGYEPTGEHRLTMRRTFASTFDGGKTEYTCEVCWMYTDCEYELPTGVHRYTEWGTTYADESHWGCIEYGSDDTGRVMKVWIHPTVGSFVGHEGHAIVLQEPYEASCSSLAGGNYVCLDCDLWFWADSTAPHDHDWYATESYEATCDSWGYDVMSCRECGDWYYVDTEAPLGHEYYDIGGEPATCDRWGYRVHRCSRCYQEYTTDVPSTYEHSWYVYDREEADCGNWGRIEYRCWDCDDYRYEDTPPVGEHDYYVGSREEATCGNWGYVNYECRNCDVLLWVSEQIPPTGEHNYVLDHVDAQPTCSNDGLEGYYCLTCSQWHHVHLAALPHAWSEPEWAWTADYSYAEAWFTCGTCGESDWVAAEITEATIAPPDGEAVGVEYTATVEFDGQTYTDVKVVEFPAEEHNWSEPVWDWDSLHFSVTATFTCEDCGEEQVLNGEIEMETTDPTCIEDGEHKWTAIVELDGEIYVTTDTQNIPALTHNYVAGDYVEPTCEVGGYTPHTCTRCGDSYKYVTEEPLGHDYGEDGVCTRCGYNPNLPALPAVRSCYFGFANFDVYVGFELEYHDEIDFVEIYFSTDGGATWTDAYRHTGLIVALQGSFRISELGLENGVYNRIMVKTVNEDGNYLPGVYMADCSLTVDIEHQPAKDIQLVVKGLLDEWEETVYESHLVIPGLTGYVEYLLLQSGEPSTGGIRRARSWNQWTDSEYIFGDSEFWYSPDAPWMLLRSNQVLEVVDDFTATVSYTQYGDWAMIEPAEPDADTAFMENLRIEMWDNGAHFVFDPLSLEDYPVYAFDFYNDITGEWRSMPWMHVGETDLWFEPDYYFRDGETILHFSALRITAFGSEGVEPAQYVTDCDIAVALDDTLDPTLEFYQEDDGQIYFKLSGMNHNYWPNFRGWQANGDWMDIWDTRVSEDGTTYTGRLPNATSLEELYAGAYLEVLHYVGANHSGDMTLGIDYFMQYIHAAGGDHAYGDPEWVWSEDGMYAEAVFTCLSNDDGVLTVPAEVTLEVWDAPGCTWEGFGRRIATVERNGRTYTNNYYGSISPVGHDYVDGRCVYCGEIELGGNLPAVNGFRFLREWVEVRAEFYWDWDEYTDTIEFYFSTDGGETWTDCVYRGEIRNDSRVWLNDFDLDSGVYNKIMIKTVDEDGLFEPGVFIGDCNLTVDITYGDPLDIQIMERSQGDMEPDRIHCYVIVQGVTANTQYYVFQSEEPSFRSFRSGSGWRANQDGALANTWYGYNPEFPYVLVKSNQNCTVESDTTATVSFTQHGDWAVIEPIEPEEDGSFLENLHVEGYPNYAVVQFSETAPDSYCIYTFDFSPDGGETWRSMPWVNRKETTLWIEPQEYLEEGETAIHFDTIRITAFGNADAEVETVQYIGDCDITIVRNTELEPEVLFLASETGDCYVSIENLAFNDIYPNVSIFDAYDNYISYGAWNVYDNGDGTADYTAPIGEWVFNGEAHVFVPETDMSRLETAYAEIIQWQNCNSEGEMSLNIEYFQTTLHPVDSNHVYKQYDEPEWVWSEDHTSAEAVFHCVADDGGQEVVTAEVEYNVWQQPGCTQQGYGWYHATVEFQGRFFSAHYEGSSPALGHDFVDGYCSRCGIVDYTDPNNIRIELTWGNGADLDARLRFNVDGVSGEVYFANKTQYIDGTLIALLDQDSYNCGPENIILIAPIAEGSYSYYVTGNGNNVANVGATVKVYRGDELLAIYTVPADLQGDYWEVFSFTGNEFEPVEHEYVSGYVEPSCEEGGYTYYTCTICGSGYREYDGTEPLGHDYVEMGHVDATCEEYGYTAYECSRCWHAYGEEDQEPLGHTYENGVCTRCDQPDPSLNHNIRIELTWGANPSDLDSHLKINLSDGTSGEVYYATDWFYYNGVKIAELDYDDTSSYGPENITIYAPIVDGTYNYYVRDYSNRTDDSSTALANSGATVRVYRGDELLMTYTVPTDIRGYIWEVFSFDGETFETLEHEYTTEYVEATCEVGGYTYYYCPGCGDSYRIYDTEPLGHDYVAGESAGPTCEDWGYIEYQCSRCDEWYREETEEPLGHDYQIVDEVEATCDESGYTKYECTLCGAGYTEEKEPLGHTYEDGFCIRCGEEEEIPAEVIRIVLTWGYNPSDLDSHLICDTVGGYGEVDYTDKTFHGNDGQLIADLDHDDTSSYGPETVTIYTLNAEDVFRYYVLDFTNRTNNSSVALANSDAAVNVYRGDELWASFTVPTDTQGYIWEVFAIVNGEIVPLEHEYTTEYVEATCEEGGYTEYACENCGDSYRIYDTAPLGHDYVAGEHTSATCEEWGYTRYECTRCGDYYKEQDEEPLGHGYVEIGREDATCEDWGYIEYECSRCGMWSQEKGDEPLGHSWGEWAIGDDEHCRTCTVCDHTEYEPHNMVETAPARLATCTEPGYSAVYSCVCGLTTAARVTDPLGHSFSGGVCIRCGVEDYDPDAFALRVQTASGCYGSEVTVSILLDNNPGIISLMIYADYDADVLELQSAQFAADFRTGQVLYDVQLTDPIQFNWVKMVGEATTQGAFVTITFKVLTEEYMETPIILTVDEENVYNGSGEPVELIAYDGVVVLNAHNLVHHGEVPAGCETDGVAEYWQCADCGKLYSDAHGINEVTAADLSIPATGHSYGEWYEYLAPDCETDGEERRDCVNCDHCEGVVIPATGHSYGEWYLYLEPGCETNGQKRSECANCDHYLSEELPATGHSYGAWYITVEPGCETVGENRRDCVVCGHYETGEVPATGHSYGEWYVYLAPGCETLGEERSECANCDHYESREVAAIGHEWGEWVVTTAPGCETAGVETRTCVHDSTHTETREVPAAGHSYGEWYVFTAPGCETIGEERRDCANCDHYETREVAAIGHEWGEWVVTTAPGCETAGVETRTCVHDSTHTETREAAALGHDYGWTDGVCTRCGGTDPDFDPMVAIVTDDVRGSAGETVTVPVVLENNPGISSLKLLIDFDTDILEFVSAEFDIAFSGVDNAMTSSNLDGGTVLLNWILPVGEVETSGTFALLTFKIKETAEAGRTSLSIRYDPGDVVNEGLEKVRFAVYPGTIEVRSHTPGDINGDGRVNNLDVITLFRYVSRWPNIQVVEDALDVTGDGRVNNLDVITLFRYVSRWPNIEIH